MPLHFVHKEIILKPGDQIEVKDGDMMVGSNIKFLDERGINVVIVAHVLMRMEPPPVALDAKQIDVTDRN